MRETHILETKNVGLYTWRGGGRGSEKVYCFYTHENVDIFGWPLIKYIFSPKAETTSQSDDLKRNFSMYIP